MKLAKHIPTGKEVMRLFSKFVFVQFVTVHNSVISRNLSCCFFVRLFPPSHEKKKQQQHAFCPMAILVTAPLIEFLYLTWFTRFSVHVSVLIASGFFFVYVYERTRRMWKTPLPVVIRPSWKSFFLRLTVSSLFLFCPQVAIKIIDKTQLNQGSLQKVSKRCLLL